MWPLDRFKAEEVLRVGRLACERWKTVDGALACVAMHALREDTLPGSQPWSDAIAALYAKLPDFSVTLVLESAWVPVMFIDIGAIFLRSTELKALVRHRFGLLPLNGVDPPSSWELRIEHRVGSRRALAYGMPPKLKQDLIGAGRKAGLDWSVITPGLAWGLERLRVRKQWAGAAGWFIWPEQDRALVARIALGEVVGLNPGAAPADEEASLKRLVEAERARRGVDSTTNPIGAARWTAAPRPTQTDQQFRWLNLGGQRDPPTPLDGSAPRAKLSV